MLENSKTVVITGGSRGIGRKMAEVFSENGYNVVINYNNSYDDAFKLYKELIDKGLNPRIFKADVSNRSEVDAMMDYCMEEFGVIDVLINNAGISQSMLFTDIMEDDWDNMMNINLKGTFNCTQSALRYILPEKKGKIINISSIWGMVGASCEVHYSVAKAGIIGFTKALAKELGPSGIQVNCIAPGIIQTDMMSDYDSDDIEDLIEKTPLERIGKTDDIAACAIYLASQGADFITGQVISPNGGFVI